ncbi:LAGLIDADG family homing endonuclease [Haliangium ochraceum]|uniref:LAGLIDADG family homing endonuclease n=1 Tax=Haliangium ochraceum TaxID=80816 RepID=UPI00019B9963|nr:LAGLIDADG family homing endonuclease [Haliangium ochraceum]
MVESALLFTNRGLLRARDLIEGVPEQGVAFLQTDLDMLDGVATSDAVYHGSVASTLRLRLAFGYELEATPEHLVGILRDNTLIHVRMDEVQAEDRVLLRRGSSVWGKTEPGAFRCVRHPSASNLKIPSTLVLDELTAEACGLLVAEGTLTQRTVAFFSNTDEDNVEAIRQWVHSVGLSLERTACPLDYAIRSVILRQFLAWLGVDYVKAADKQIPAKIMLGGRELMRAFLRGFIEGDGHVDIQKGAIEVSSASERLLQEMQLALLGFGILSARRPKTVIGRDHIYWRLVIYDIEAYEKEVGFISARNQCRLHEALARNAKRKRNPNVDTVPINKYVRRLYEAARTQPSWNHREGRIFGSYVHGSHAPSRAALQRLLKRWEWDCPDECEAIQEFLSLPAAFLAVETIEEREARVVGVCVPEQHEFVVNGFASRTPPELTRNTGG